MTQTLPPRPRSTGTYVALALFLVAYVAVLALVLAPQSVMPVETGAIFTAGE